MRIFAYVGKVSELREMLARHRDFLAKEKALSAATVGQ